VNASSEESDSAFLPILVYFRPKNWHISSVSGRLEDEQLKVGGGSRRQPPIRLKILWEDSYSLSLELGIPNESTMPPK
uniref:Uncharacterized protein n=1 Tax=Romanomermis culicivorax TaxID=13658 RepID=A0A915ID06_ROMCU